MKLGLGTVQFGMDYGISNEDGQTPENEVMNILQYAKEKEVSLLDTASQYGNSEEVIGRCRSIAGGFKIITKTPRLTDEADNTDLLWNTFQNSLVRLKRSSIYGLLVHQAQDIFTPAGPRLMQKMTELKEKGLVEKIGVSVYTGEQIDEVWERNYPVDIIQLPLNVLDQRLIKSGHLTELKEKGVEIHARSLFLQGLLLMNPDKLSPYFDKVKKELRNYYGALKEKELTPMRAALLFAEKLGVIDVIICGVNNVKQLAELIAELEKVQTSRVDFDFGRFASNEIDIIDPTRWKQ